MKNFKFFCIVIMVVAMQVSAFSQGISINSDGTPPDNSAMLDIKSPTSPSLQMGVLFPQVNLANAFNGGAATHLFGVNTNTAFNAGSRFNSGLGLYRFDGTRWNRLLESTDSTMFWGTRGNANTDTLINFIGTTDNNDLLFKTNNLTRLTIPTNLLRDFVFQRGRDVLFKVSRGVEFPDGTSSSPSIRFAGIGPSSGFSSPTSTSVALTFSSGGGIQYSGGLAGGLKINNSTSGHPGLPQSGTRIDSDGSIYTRDQIVYSRGHNSGVSGEETGQDRTAEVKRYWSTSFSGAGESVPFYSETNTSTLQIQFRMTRVGTDYFLEMRKYGTGNKSYVSSNLTGATQTLPGAASAWGNWMQVTNAMTAGVGINYEIMISSEQSTGGNNLEAIYKIIIFFNGRNNALNGTDYIRVLTEAYYNH